MERMGGSCSSSIVRLILVGIVWVAASGSGPRALAYRPGDIVPMSRMGQYHSVRTLPSTLSPLYLSRRPSLPQMSDAIIIDF